MTPDPLKQARAKEAVRLVSEKSPYRGWTWLPAFAERVSLETQNLIDIDWRPPEPINPDLIEARECCALVAEKEGCPGEARNYRAGLCDDYLSVQSTLLAIECAKDHTQ